MKPKVITKCVANGYTADHERIVEVSDRETRKGCLIAVRRIGAGLNISVYHCDDGVDVTVERGKLVDDERDALRAALKAIITEIDAARLDPLHPIVIQAENARALIKG